MRFVVDAQLPPALARILSDHGHVAEHVFEIGLAEARDREIWRYALDHNAIIITKVRTSRTWPPSAETHRSLCGCGSGTHTGGHFSSGSNHSS